MSLLCKARTSVTFISSKIDFAFKNSCSVIDPRSYIPSSFKSCSVISTAKDFEQIIKVKSKTAMIFFMSP